jgi:hypothetical protein
MLIQKYHLSLSLFSPHFFSVQTPLQLSSKINCEIHTDVQIDYFCSQHDVVCCRACIPESHSSCKTVIPLDVASKDVTNSSLLSDTLKELDFHFSLSLFFRHFFLGQTLLHLLAVLQGHRYILVVFFPIR